MKQQKDSIFFQSSLYVAELCEPLSLIEFCSEDKKIENEVIKSQASSEKLAKLESPKESYNRSYFLLNKIVYSFLAIEKGSLWIDLGIRCFGKIIWCIIKLRNSIK